MNAISDITGAAGWEILGCSPDAEAQDIRLVCKSDSSHDCAHLYQNIGAVGKIVRLPENVCLNITTVLRPRADHRSVRKKCICTSRQSMDSDRSINPLLHRFPRRSAGWHTTYSQGLTVGY